MRKSTITLLMIAAAFGANAQALQTKKGIRIYEHHSSSLNKGAPFGNGANGNYSGYDFVKHAYKSSFNPANGGKWSAAEAKDLDMVEHNGPYGNGGAFGVTAATSSIWGGSIAGNGTTTLHPAPSSFNYDTVKDVATIQKAHPIVLGANTITAATVGKVYLCRITRQVDYWVAMKITAVKALPSTFKQGDTASMYFEFEYKYGTVGKKPTTGIEEVQAGSESFSLFPNPTNGAFSIGDVPASVQLLKSVIRVTDITGKVISTLPATTGLINPNLQAGIYFVTLTDGTYSSTQKLVVTN